MKLYIGLLISLIPVNLVFGQLTRGDSILSHENAIQRPLNLHKNQIRAGIGYDFYVYNSAYDLDGNKQKLSDQGIAVGRTEVPVSLQYGILEFLELSVGFQYNSQVYRALPVVVASSYDRLTFINEYTYRRGVSDVALMLLGRVPLKTRKFDLLVMAGADMPIAGTEPATPDHSVQSTVIIDSVTEIKQNFYETWGSGTMVYHLGGGFKFRFTRGAINFFGRYDIPSGISESIKWSHRLIDLSRFEYTFESYQYQLDEVLEFRFRGEFLLFPWFDITMDLDYFRASGGWSEITGKRAGNYDSSEVLFAPGYEILATPRLWIRQRMTLPLSGNNMLASTSFETRLIYNLFIK